MKTLLTIAAILFAQATVAPVENGKEQAWTVKGKVITVRVSNPKESWRFVHDGAELRGVPWYGGSETATQLNLVECEKLADVRKAIKDKGLKLTADQQAELDDMKENAK